MQRALTGSRDRSEVPWMRVAQAALSPGQPEDEFSALNALIQDRGTRWSTKARAIKFDIEFRSVEQERRRVANDLHDEILPSLSRLIRTVQSELTARSEKNLQDAGEPPALPSFAPNLPLAGEPPALPGEIATSLLNELRLSVANFRDLLAELHPVDLEELGLVAALSNLCKRYARLTGRSVTFVEKSEACNLSELQQRCLYRAMQATLKMFAETQYEQLLLAYDLIEGSTVVSARCVDASGSNVPWLTEEKRDFDAFEAWCAMAGAEVQLNEQPDSAFRCDLVLDIPNTPPATEDVASLVGELSQVRLRELDQVIELAQEQWIERINKDCSLFKNLAVDMERKRISTEISKVVLPQLERIGQLAIQWNEQTAGLDIIARLQEIKSDLNSVLTELHPRLLAQTGLFASIRSLVDRFKHASMVDTTVISNLWSKDIEHVSLEKKSAIYHVIQEAFNNIEKHSGATRALISVVFSAGELLVRIEDNGRGFQGSKSTLSRGLKIIQERASGVGAHVSWNQSASFYSGTLVTISIRF